MAPPLPIKEISVILEYGIKNNEMAINIQEFSMHPDEEDILSVPFSVFEVKDRIENKSITSSGVLIEIHLEECE